MSRHKDREMRAVESESNAATTQMWHGVVDSIRLLPSIPNSKSAGQPEHHLLEDALEKLSSLIALRRAESASAKAATASVSVSVPSRHATPQAQAQAQIPITAAPAEVAVPAPAPTPTPTLKVDGGAGVKRKRRPSQTLSPAPAKSPLPAQNLPQAQARDSPVPATTLAPPPPLLLPPRSKAISRSNTPHREAATGKQGRKQDGYHDQLPFHPGRKVALRIPDGDGGFTWILAVVKRSIGSDRTKYELHDADDENATFNTNLASIIPLPDSGSPTHLSSHPSNLDDFPKGAAVLAMYPETTSFYRAQVVTPPVPGTGNGNTGRTGLKPEPGALHGMYRVAFEDDDGKVQGVDYRFVVMYPRS